MCEQEKGGVFLQEKKNQPVLAGYQFFSCDLICQMPTKSKDNIYHALAIFEGPFYVKLGQT